MEAASFDIHGDEGAGEVRIVIGGELDLDSAPRLQRTAEKLLKDEPRRLVLDLSALRFIDSSGLRVMILLHERSLREGWQLQVARPPAPVLRIFQISGMDEHLNLIDADATDEAP